MKDLSRSPSSKGVGTKLDIDGIESPKSTRQSDKVFTACKRCGFWCNTKRDSKCPFCGTENYWKVNR